MSTFDPADPTTWGAKRQAAFMGGSLKDFLAVVPTERSMYNAPEEVEPRKARATQIAEAMDAVYKVMDEPQ